MFKNYTLLSVVLACLLCLTGCEGDPLKKVEVHGVVTFDGKPCPGPGRVSFSPIEVAPGLIIRPASGAFEADGAYTASSFRPGDGLVPGRYRVGVACYDASKLSGAPGDNELRAANYVSKSFEPKELVVEVGSKPIEFNLDVPLKK